MMRSTTTSRSSISRRHFLTCSAALGVGALATGVALPAALLADEPSQGAGAPPSPAEALERLRNGNARFAAGQPINPQQDLARLREVAPQQRPFAALLGCADSRVPIELVYDQGFGDVFVVRVAGNVATSVEIASLEYGTRVLGATALVVLGHSNCGAVKAALQGGEVPGQISTLYQHIAPALDRKKMDLDAAIVANVRYQARKLKKGSTVLSRLLVDGKLALVGAVFELETGKVRTVEL
jgi:carbonic anhydrase